LTLRERIFFPEEKSRHCVNAFSILKLKIENASTHFLPGRKKQMLRQRIFYFEAENRKCVNAFSSRKKKVDVASTQFIIWEFFFELVTMIISF
jgi:hypothetical protein